MTTVKLLSTNLATMILAHHYQLQRPMVTGSSTL